MDIRELHQSDASDIKQVARESLDESYGHEFDDDTIQTVVNQWYDEETVESILSEDNLLFLIADNDKLHGYVQGETITGETVIGDIYWLHVRPDARGSGIGSQLLGEVLDRMENEGVAVVRGRVLEVNQDGIEFYEEHGFGESASSTTEIAGDEYEEIILERRLDEENEPILEEIEGPEGQELFVDYASGETGVIAPMYPTFLDESLEERYGWLCRNCGSTDTSMDASGRVECADCENARKATRWDSSYL